MIIIATWGYTDSMCEDIHSSIPTTQKNTNKKNPKVFAVNSNAWFVIWEG